MTLRLLVGDGAPGDPVAPADLAAVYAEPTDATSWLRVNMVATVDGAAAGSSGTSGSINTDADHAVFEALRAWADVIVVGAGTVRAEEYGPADVPICVVSGRGEVPASLRGADVGKVLLATSAASPGLGAARAELGEDQVLVVGEDPDRQVDHRALRRELEARGHRRLLGEGGPSLLGAMLAAGVVDELCATIAPVLVGGEPGRPGRITAGPDVEVPLRLLTLLEDEGTLLARWSVVQSRP